METIRIHEPDLSTIGSPRLSGDFALFFEIAFRDESQRGRVDAISQSGWLGTIGKDMAEVGIAGF